MLEKKNLIAEVPISDRPRERLQAYGEKALSSQELLAILLRTGYKEKNVMHLAMQVLNSCEGLYGLRLSTLEEFQSIKGIGVVKALELKAAIELGIRVSQASQIKSGEVTSSQRIGEMMVEEMRSFHQEHLVTIFLNTKNEIIKKETIFIGSLNQSIAHPREIFRGAVRYSAARIILVHNHPSGNPRPSRSDILFTKRMQTCGDFMGIEVLDHFIIGSSSYVSLKEEGKL